MERRLKDDERKKEPNKKALKQFRLYDKIENSHILNLFIRLFCLGQW